MGARAARLRSSLPALGMVVLTIGAFGCASIPGKTGQEQAATMDELASRTLADLEKQDPHTKSEIDSCVGYVVMSNKLTKIPLVGVGAGYGVAIEHATGAKTYVRMRRFDLGLGWGARAVRPVLIFQDAKPFRDFIDGDFSASLGAEATAKAGGKGGGGSGGSSQSADEKKGYTSYVITDTGASATALLAFVRVKPVKLKK